MHRTSSNAYDPRLPMTTAAPAHPAPAPEHGRDAGVHLVSADAAFLAGEVSVARAVGELLQVVRESMQLEVVFVGKIAQGRRFFSYVSSSLAKPPIEHGASNALEETICQRILDGRLPAWIPSVQAIAEGQGLSADHKALAAHIGVPVHLPDGRLYGMLCGFNLQANTTLDARDVKRLEIAATAAARLLSQADGREEGTETRR